MLILEIWKVALQAIRANKLRSFLTMLGIIFGVGAVITMMAIGSGAQKAVQDNISALGTNLLTVVPGQSFMRGVASDVRVSLTVADADTLRNAGTAHIQSVMPEIGRPLQVKRGSQNINVSITGVVPEYFPAHTYVVTAGSFFTAGDDQQRRRVALLGSAVPDMFQANPVAMVGQQILIRGIPFDIIGVLGAKGSQSSFMNPDEQIFIPLNTARYRVHGTDRVRAIGLKVDDGANMNLAMIEAERALRRTHKIRPGGENDFQIRNQADLMATLNATTQTLGALLAAVAAVSLLINSSSRSTRAQDKTATTIDVTQRLAGFDAFMEKTLHDWNAPGIGVGIGSSSPAARRSAASFLDHCGITPCSATRSNGAGHLSTYPVRPGEPLVNGTN